MTSSLTRATGAQQSPPRVSRGVLAVLALVAMLGWLNGAALSPFLSEIARDLDTTIPRLGQITTALFLLGAGVSLLVGPLADARGARRLLLAGLVAVAICSLGTALAPNYLSLLVVRLAGAFSAGALGGVSIGFAAKIATGAEQRRAIGWVTSGIAAGAVLGVPALTAAGSLLGWRAAFALLAINALLALLLVRTLLPDDAQAGELRVRGALGSYRTLGGDPNMLALYASSMMRSIGWMGYLVYAGAFFDAVHGLSTRQIGWTYTVGGLGFFLGIRLASGRLGNRPLRRIYAVASTISALALGALLVLPLATLVACGLLFVTSFALGVGNICLSSLLASETPAGSGTTMALNSSVVELGTAGGGAVGGLMIALGGYTALGIALPLFTLLSVCLVVWQPAVALRTAPVLVRRS
jgi:MFS transporter, DHA1 family, inner membrane transport protein